MGTYGYATVQIGGTLYAKCEDHPNLDKLKNANRNKTYDQATWEQNIHDFLVELDDLENNDNPFPAIKSLQDLASYANEMDEPLYGFDLSAKECRFEYLNDLCNYFGLHIIEYSPTPYGDNGSALFASSLEHGMRELIANDEDPVIIKDDLYTYIREYLEEKKDIDGFVDALNAEFGGGILSIPSFKVQL